MADNHYEIGTTNQRGRVLRATLDKLRGGFGELRDSFASMTAMLDGDGTQDSHYALVAELFNVQGADAAAKNADAHALYAELNSTLNGDGKAALLQLLARTG